MLLGRRAVVNLVARVSLLSAPWKKRDPGNEVAADKPIVVNT